MGRQTHLSVSVLFTKLTAFIRRPHAISPAASETLLLLHSVNWLHNSIRSETVLLLNAGDALPPSETVPNQWV